MRRAHLTILAAAMALGACGLAEREPRLHDLRTFSGEPEEFSITPRKPLVAPEDTASLPAPTPGGTNRTDQTPLQDAVAALGGNPARMADTGGVPRGDGARINSASRNGRDSAIRDKLASEDLEYRKRRSLFTWSIVPTDEYYRAYERQSLDPYRWLDVFRRADRRTPTAPPAAR